MSDVFSRRNLPGEAEQWGREVETRQVGTERSIETLKQSTAAQNRNTASSLESLANQLRAIADTQATLLAQQSQLSDQQTALTATVNLLATQTVSDSKTTETPTYVPPGGTNWIGFDGTYDCSLTITTGPAGKLLIQANANMLAAATTTLLGIEIVGVAGPSVPGPFSTYVTGSTSIVAAGASRSLVANLAANTAYTVRTRRGTMGSGGSSIWASQSLVVTRS